MNSSLMETLTGAKIQLRPLLASDAAALVEAAADGELWNLPFTVIPSAQTVEGYIRVALEGRANGSVMPFVIKVLEADRIVGTTRFWKIDRQNRKLEIGHTWLSASWQRTYVNTEAKFLMLSYAFEKLRCVRVQFTTDEVNEKSRSALLRLGAKQEGVIRHERIMPDGRKRDSVRFSIIDEEWPSVRQALEKRLNEPGLWKAPTVSRPSGEEGMGRGEILSSWSEGRFPAGAFHSPGGSEQ